jgi:hypothetical protein
MDAWTEANEEQDGVEVPASADRGHWGRLLRSCNPGKSILLCDSSGATTLIVPGRGMSAWGSVSGRVLGSEEIVDHAERDLFGVAW